MSVGLESIANVTRPISPHLEHHCRPVAISPANSTSFTLVVNIDRSLECNHSLSHIFL
ncbi:BZ3500_MvSof-1268-A1-R1_Chr3-1g05413 [Microbotryum saponariae]|uniref:BZ3500_MvSof-1268-A1-R1_Chr3-1g05413 protein n=1 Tax=Microbotryum saponariae TaxID=289078 RepID=A0A2X0LQJ9_9BASI|nr:BZ3500_MvSof-1268-A1-R1_Chr3-1g05413 [Microbotryum saponariae]